MRTALIKLGRGDTDGYPVELYCDSEGAGWRDAPLATATIPSTLSPPAPPQLNGEAATVDLVHDWLLRRPAAPNPRSPLFGDLGAWLRGLLFRDAVAEAWERLTGKYPGEVGGEEGIRLQLEIDRGSGLARLPWELTAGDGPLALFANPANPCARVHRFGRAGATTGTDCYPLLRVLVVIGADPADAVVKVEQELEQLRRAFHPLWGLVDLEELERPSQDELKAGYRDVQPHVLHFIGHGRPRANDVVLEIAPKGAQAAWQWTSAGIGAVVMNAPPRLAILNTCRSTQRHAGGGWAIADAFAQARVPAVVGMQGDIEGEAAVRFTQRLYEGLVAHEPLDVAVAAARSALVLLRGEDSPDPWLPCLTLSAEPDSVLPARYGITEQHAQAVETAEHFRGIRYFVDRSACRRQLWHGTGPVTDERKGGALVVIGAEQVGKSGLVRWCLGAHALRGANVAYVDLRGKPLDSLQVLRAIVRELAASPVHGEANGRALAELGARLNDLDAFASAGAQPARGQPPEEEIADLFGELCAAFEGIDPIVALDHVDCVEPAHWAAYVAKHLLDPAARGEVAGRLIVVVSDAHASRLTAALQPPQTPHIGLPALTGADYDEAVPRFFCIRDFDPDRAQALTVAYHPGKNGVWRAGVFDLLSAAIDIFAPNRVPGR